MKIKKIQFAGKISNTSTITRTDISYTKTSIQFIDLSSLTDY